MKGNQNHSSNYYFLSYQTRNSKKISNSHISSASGPKMSIREPNSRFWCQLSNISNGIMFLTILTLIALSGNSKICGSERSIHIKFLVGTWKETVLKVFTCIKKNSKNATNEISNNERFSSKMATESKTGIETPKKFFFKLKIWLLVFG